jgi:hypothetical protein
MTMQDVIKEDESIDDKFNFVMGIQKVLQRVINALTADT